MRDVLLKVMAEKGLGKATLRVELVCVLLDPRRKSFDDDQFVNGSAALSTRAGEALEGAHRDICGRAHAIACASAGVVGGKPGDRGTRSEEEEAFENGEEACGTCGRCSCW